MRDSSPRFFDKFYIIFPLLLDKYLLFSGDTRLVATVIIGLIDPLHSVTFYQFAFESV